jgi:hypothetical protein
VPDLWTFLSEMEVEGSGSINSLVSLFVVRSACTSFKSLCKIVGVPDL